MRVLLLILHEFEMQMKTIQTLILLLFTLNAVSAKSHQEAYIEKYASIAVSEMYRSGVPASITLAQGLLESGYGLSELALKSNNHFGIKCHNNWKGGRVYHDDDAKGECFRKYAHPEESYRDHSDFLRYRDRYKFLFDYKITDYKSWAYGLKKAGYATDPKYPVKLIGLIETYNLHQYDTKKPSFAQHDQVRTEGTRQRKFAPSQSIPAPPSQVEQVTVLAGAAREVFNFALSRQMYSQNGVAFVYASDGETYRSIAESNNLFLRELLSFNDLKDAAPLSPGTVVYLQKKKKQAVKGIDMHVVEAGETLRSIAQRYGVSLKSICRMNGLVNDGLIREGDMIRLRK